MDESCQYTEIEGEVTSAELECTDYACLRFSVGEHKLKVTAESYGFYMIPVLRCCDYVVVHVDYQKTVKGLQILDQTKKVVLSVIFNDGRHGSGDTVYFKNKFV